MSGTKNKIKIPSLSPDIQDISLKEVQLDKNLYISRLFISNEKYKQQKRL